MLFTDISADNEESWYTITATPSGNGALGLYCSSAAAVVSPSAAASQYYSSALACKAHRAYRLTPRARAWCMGRLSGCAWPSMHLLVRVPT